MVRRIELRSIEEFLDLVFDGLLLLLLLDTEFCAAPAPITYPTQSDAEYSREGPLKAQ